MTWTLVGPLVGGLLVAGLGTGWAFIVDASTFAFSAVMILLMRTRRVPRSEEDHTSPWEDLKEGVRYVRSRTWLWVALVAATVSLLATWGPGGPRPYVVRNELGGSAAAQARVRRRRARRGDGGRRSGSVDGCRSARSLRSTSRGRSGC